MSHTTQTYIRDTTLGRKTKDAGEILLRNVAEDFHSGLQ